MHCKSLSTLLVTVMQAYLKWVIQGPCLFCQQWRKAPGVHMQWGGLWYRGYVCKTIYTLTCCRVDCGILDTCATQHIHMWGGLWYRGYVCETTHSHAVGWTVVSWVRVQDNTLTCSGVDCGIVGTCARQHTHMQWGGLWYRGYVCKTSHSHAVGWTVVSWVRVQDNTLTCSGVDCGIVGTCARQHTHMQWGGLWYRGYVCKTTHSHAVGWTVVSWVRVQDHTLTCSGVDCGTVGTCARQHTHMQWGGLWYRGYVCKTTHSHAVGWTVVSWVRVQDNTLTCSGVDCGIVGTCARQHTHMQWGGLWYRGYVCKTTHSHAVGWTVVSWVRVQDNTLTCSGVDCGIVGTCARQHTHMQWGRLWYRGYVCKTTHSHAMGWTVVSWVRVQDNTLTCSGVDCGIVGTCARQHTHMQWGGLWYRGYVCKTVYKLTCSGVEGTCARQHVEM